MVTEAASRLRVPSLVLFLDRYSFRIIFRQVIYYDYGSHQHVWNMVHLNSSMPFKLAFAQRVPCEIFGALFYTKEYFLSHL